MSLPAISCSSELLATILAHSCQLWTKAASTRRWTESVAAVCPNRRPRNGTVGARYGNRCMGCGEIIEIADEEYFLNLRGIALLRFHDVCYSAWVTFKRS